MSNTSRNKHYITWLVLGTRERTSFLEQQQQQQQQAQHGHYSHVAGFDSIRFLQTELSELGSNDLEHIIAIARAKLYIGADKRSRKRRMHLGIRIVATRMRATSGCIFLTNNLQ